MGKNKSTLSKKVSDSDESVLSLRKHAEKKLKEEEITTNGSLSHEETQFWMHELRVHQYELEIQNEELRRSQEELEISRLRYFELYNLTPVGYFTTGKNGKILDVNLAGVDLLGESKVDILKKTFTKFILPEDQDIYYLHHKNLLHRAERQEYELRMVRKDGSEFWARLVETITNDENNETFIYRTVLNDITERKLAEEKVNNLLHEKELLLKEVHHRVKNNMTTIMSLMSLQANTLKERSAINALNKARGRIRSMAALYDKLSISEGFKEVSILKYLSPLVDDIALSLSEKTLENFLNIEKNIDDFFLESETLFFLGIILNELITNIMKYAFTGNGNVIRLSASKKDKRVTVILQDNGVGLPLSVNLDKPSGLGLQIVNSLTTQINGSIKVERDNGTKFILEFDI